MGTSLGASEEKLAAARQELNELIAASGELEPDRGNLDDDSHKFRFGKPNYTLTNLEYFKGKTRKHSADSLEKVVENMVKTWEMEASHKEFKDWTLVNHEKYFTQANGAKAYVGEESAKAGNYNWLMESCQKDLYDSSAQTFESSHQIFGEAFPDGFAWEVLDVFSGPPTVGFSWRHFARFTGTYNGRKGDGKTHDMYGFAIVNLDGNSKITSIQIYYKPDEFLKVLEGKLPLEALKNGPGGFPDFANLNIGSAEGCPFVKEK